MAYETGIAQNERDLLEKLDKFLTQNPTLVERGQAWERLFDRSSPATNLTVETREILWKSTGTGIGQDIYAMAATYNNIAQDAYNLAFRGGTFFNAELIVNNKVQLKDALSNHSESVVLYGDARPFEYHFFANGRHFKVATRISKVTSTAYVGFILPTVLPTEYPFPLCVAGSGKTYIDDNILNRYSRTDVNNASPFMGYTKQCFLMLPAQDWREFAPSNSKLKIEDHWIFPSARFKEYAYEKSFPRINGIGCQPLMPFELITVAPEITRWGAFDGVYWIPGIQRETGDVVTLADNEGIVFNDGFRHATTSYFVFEKDE